MINSGQRLTIFMVLTTSVESGGIKSNYIYVTITGENRISILHAGKPYPQKARLLNDFKIE